MLVTVISTTLRILCQ